MNNYLNKILDKKNEKNILILFFCLFFLILTVRYLGVHLPFFLGNLPLAIDEAQYLAWSRELGLGYFSKPPFIAWILGVNSFIFGDVSNSHIRNLQPLGFAISSIFVSLSSFEITKKKSIAVWTGFLFFTLPISSFYSQFATTDAWLLFFWSISLYFLIKATITDKPKWWIFCGTSVGFGLLTKYSMVFFLFSAFIYLLSQKKVFTKNPWLSFCISILVFSPNVIWNIYQKFPTVIHHAEMTNIDKELLLSFKPVMEFFLGQFIVFGPFLFLLFLIISFKQFVSKIFFEKNFVNLRLTNPIFEMLLIFSWTIILFVLCLSFFGETEINWAAPGSISICLLITSFISHEQFQFSKKIKVTLVYIFTFSIFLHLIFLFCFISGPRLFSFTDKENDPNFNPFLQVNGYQNLLKIISKTTQGKKNFLIVAEDRGILANIAINFPSSKIRSWQKTSQIRHHWDLTKPLTNDDLTKQLLMVIKINSLSPQNIDNLKNEIYTHFQNVKKVIDPELDKIILQGKKHQKVMLFWVNNDKKDLNL